MDLAEIEKLEAHFAIRLPGTYREALLNYPHEHEFEEFTGDAVALRETNEGCRKNLGWDFPWPHHLWWIGDDGSGGFYFISSNDAECMVYYFDYEVPAASFERTRRLPRCSNRITTRTACVLYVETGKALHFISSFPACWLGSLRFLY